MSSIRVEYLPLVKLAAKYCFVLFSCLHHGMHKYYLLWWLQPTQFMLISQCQMSSNYRVVFVVSLLPLRRQKCKKRSKWESSWMLSSLFVGSSVFASEFLFMPTDSMITYPVGVHLLRIKWNTIDFTASWAFNLFSPGFHLFSGIAT